jgi:hypothetical protein
MTVTNFLSQVVELVRNAGAEACFGSSTAAALGDGHGRTCFDTGRGRG